MKIEEAAKENQYPYNEKFGMWSVEITEHISRSWFKKGVEFAQRWININEEKPESMCSVLLKDNDGFVCVGFRTPTGLYKAQTYYLTGESNITLHDVLMWRPIEHK